MNTPVLTPLHTRLTSWNFKCTCETFDITASLEPIRVDLCVFTCEVGGAEEVRWQRLVGDHGPRQVFELGQVSQDSTECQDSQVAVMVQQQGGETS